MESGMHRALSIGLIPLVLGSLPAVAQEYPAREIRSICNFSAGSGADILVRYYSDRLARLAGKPVIVENKVGAQGNIATEHVARSKADGYTIMITPASSTLAAARHTFKQLPFDPIGDFTPVTTLARLGFTIAVDAKKPIGSIGELTEYLKRKSGNGMYGTGTNTGLVAAELYKDKTGLKTTQIPYKQSTSALIGLLGGDIDFMVYDATFMIAHARAGKVRLLALTSAARSGALPEVPTMSESGFPGYDVTPWWGVVVPAGTPRPIVEKLAAWFNRISASEETRKFLENVATEPLPGTPESMAELIRSDTEQWGRFVRLAKIEPQ